MRGVMKAKGRWPFSGSGMPTTLASLMEGWERMTCSIWPVFVRDEEGVDVGWMVHTRAEAMSCDVDDIVGPGHNVHIAIFINQSSVSRVHPASIEPLQISLVKTFVILEEVCERRRCQWCGHDDVPHRSTGHFVAFVVDDAHVEPGHRETG